MTVLEFIFQDFWHFCGAATLLSIAVSPFHVLFAALGVRHK